MYTPFEKEISQIEAADLATLRTVSEGWYVEYKRDCSTAAAMAKSVAAFANTYGGWVFYGVEEKSKDEAVAGAFPGFSVAEIDAALQRLRQAVANQVTPSPHFDVKIVRGPCSEIGLADNRVVLCVRVPWSPNTPHVHSSGRIYRRVGDGSEPKAENDRFVLDQLWKRGDDVRQHYADWVEREPEFSKSEQSYLRLLLVADLWRDRNLWAEVNLGELREIMRSSGGPGSNVPFETVHTSADGFIARQTSGGQPQMLGLTWWFHQDLRSEILIPLNRYEANDPYMFKLDLHGFEHAERFASILAAQGFRDTPVIDLNFLFNILTGVVNIQSRLSAKAGWEGSFFFKAQLLGVWRTCPFIDLDIVLDEFDKHGVPLCLNERVEVLPGSRPESFLIVPSHDEEIADARVVVQTLSIFQPIARALGVPEWIPVHEDDPQRFYPNELVQAGVRAMEAQRHRNERDAKRE